MSFVVPAHNEEQLLGATLEAIHRAAAAVGIDYELIVVDDASTDRTAEIARTAGARIISVDHRQIAGTRNSGARAATGGLLVFVDADTIINTRVLSTTIAAINGGAVGGGAVLTFDDPMPWSARALAAIVRAGMLAATFAAGAYLFCTAAAFERTGGFDETLFASEELTLSRALRKVGPVVILREPVLTSGRKARTHGFRELWAPIWLILRYGPSALRDRAHMSLWYGHRRRDPRESGRS